MPTLNIGDRRVKVDDSFLQLSLDQQNAAVVTGAFGIKRVDYGMLDSQGAA